MLDYKDVLKQLDPLASNKITTRYSNGTCPFHVNDLSKAKEFFIDTLGYQVQLDYKKSSVICV